MGRGKEECVELKSGCGYSETPERAHVFPYDGGSPPVRDLRPLTVLGSMGPTPDFARARDPPVQGEPW